MRSDQDFDALCEEFEDLADADVNLTKEVYAHFGLVFFTFGLAEHTLINAIHLHRLHAALPDAATRTQDLWSIEWERLEPIIDKLTFGQLAGEAKTIAEFASLVAELDWAIAARNYFAHKFFRKEVDKSHSDDGRKLLLGKMARTRRRVQRLDTLLSARYFNMCRRFGIEPQSEKAIAIELKRDKKAAELAIASDAVEFGWTP
jgi:hypothetical protein